MRPTASNHYGSVVWVEYEIRALRNSSSSPEDSSGPVKSLAGSGGFDAQTAASGSDEDFLNLARIHFWQSRMDRKIASHRIDSKHVIAGLEKKNLYQDCRK